MNGKKILKKEVNEILKGKNIGVLCEENDKYSKRRFIHIANGYDFLGRWFVVRTYVQKRYDISSQLLELLLALMELKLFTRKMFASLPKHFTYSRWSTFVENGYVSLVMDDPDTEKRIYTLSTKYRNIVKKTYHYLSGEEKIPEDSVHNPMANKKKQVPFDKKKLALIKKLNELETPEHKRYLFE